MMKLLKTKVCVLAVFSCLLFPALVGAETAAAPANPPITKTAPSQSSFSVAQTNVNGIYVPGIYLTDKDSLVAYIPGGVGLVVVNKATALPKGAYYVK